MAALSPLRKQLKLGTGLAETSLEEQSNLANRAAPPTSPLEAGVLGANPHQAKMAGTPGQKANALRTAITGENDLATAQRRQQLRSEATTQEQQKMQKGQELTKLGDLNSRVQQLSQQLLAPTAPANAELTALSSDPETNQLLNNIKTNPNDNQSIVNLYKKLGKTKASEIIAADGTISNDAKNLIKNQFEQADQTIGKALASSVQDVAESGQLDFQALGFTDSTEVANLLGVSPEDFNKMSVSDLINKVNGELNNEYNNVDELQNKAIDLNVGAAERAEARKQLRDMGAVGIRAVESETDLLADKIANADTVKFLDTDIKIQDLLSDDFVSGLVKKYSEETDDNGQPLSDWAEKFQADEPDLVSFIKDNRNLIKQAADKVDSGLANFATTQYQNMNVGNTAVGKIPADILEQLSPGYDDLTTGVKQPPAIINALNDKTIPENKRANVLSSLGLLKDKTPELVRQAANLDINQLDKLGFTDQNSDKFRLVSTYLDNANKIKSMDTNDPDSVARFLGLNNYKQLKDLMTEADTRNRSGLFGESPDLAKIRTVYSSTDTPVQFAEKLKKLYLDNGSAVSLGQLAQATPNDYTKNVKNINDNYNNISNAAYKYIKPALNNDSLITPQELKESVKTAGLDDLNILYTTDAIQKRAKGNLTNVLLDRAREIMLPDLNKITSKAMPGISFDAMMNKLDSPETIKSGIGDLKYNAEKVVQSLRALKQDADNTGNKLKSNYLDRLINTAVTSISTMTNTRAARVSQLQAEYNKDLKAKGKMTADEIAKSQSRQPGALIIPGKEDIESKVPIDADLKANPDQVGKYDTSEKRESDNWFSNRV